MKSFRQYVPEQSLMLPPDVREWVPDGHLARFVEEVSGLFGLEEFYASYEEDGRGLSAYHPLLMVRLLLYGSLTGRYSSRKLERATYEDVPTRYLVADAHPDHARIAAFRTRHEKALEGIFVQVVLLCARAGLVKLGRVAIDGTKIKANASRFKSLTYAQMQEEEKQWAVEQVRRWMAEAERVDRAEDEEYGKHRRGDELPAELATTEKRRARIRELMEQMKQEAREKAQRDRVEAEKHLEQRRREEERRGRRFGGRPPKMPDPEKAEPKPTAQRNLIDSDSRIMKDNSSNSFQQAYNAQVVVDEENQIIVAAAVTQQEHDREQLVPMINQVKRNLGQKPKVILADSGYWGPEQLTDESLNGTDLYLPPEGNNQMRRRGKASRWSRNPELLDQLRQKMKTQVGRDQYRARQGIVEPVFGQIKHAHGFRQFLMRGLKKVSVEWSLLCTAHDLLKLYGAGGMRRLRAAAAQT